MEDLGDSKNVVDRLRALGREPVDPALASAHLTAMAVGRPGARGWTRLKVGAAFAAGLLLGGTGLASAGALPDPVQDVAHGALRQVGIDVPPGHDRYNGPECGKDEDGKPWKNHGQYVSAHHDDEAAAHSRCGKPTVAGGKATTTTTVGATTTTVKGNPRAAACQGPPVWATDKTLTPEQKTAAQAARKALCGDEASEADDDAPGQGSESDDHGKDEGQEHGGASQGKGPKDQPTANVPAKGRPDDAGRSEAGDGGNGAGKPEGEAEHGHQDSTSGSTLKD